jgi:hypothetical protein
MAADIAYLQIAGGSVQEHSLPLHWAVQGQLDKGYIARVNEDGSPWTEPAPEPEEPLGPKEPAKNASKADWAAYAKAIDDELTDEDIEGMTRDGLAELYGKK